MKRLTPKGCVECYQIGVAVYFDANGKRTVHAHVHFSDAEETTSLHELLGALEYAKAILLETYDETAS